MIRATKNFFNRICMVLFFVTAILFFDYHRQVSKVPDTDEQIKETLVYAGFNKLNAAGSWAANALPNLIERFNTSDEPVPIGVVEDDVKVQNDEPVSVQPQVNNGAFINPAILQ